MQPFVPYIVQKQVTVHSILSNIKTILYEKRKKSNCAFEDFML